MGELRNWQNWPKDLEINEIFLHQTRQGYFVRHILQCDAINSLETLNVDFLCQKEKWTRGIIDK